MGRSKGVHINTLAKALVLKAGYIFNTNFTHNKNIVKKLGLYMQSKPEQSKLAGAITAMASKAAKIEAEEKASKEATEKAAAASQPAAIAQTPASAPAPERPAPETTPA